MESSRRSVGGRYELIEVIGRGAMGTVYRATDSVLGRPVAVKLLSGMAADHDPTSITRFEREARAAAALNHPAVVAVYDTGSDEMGHFIVMELVQGQSLEALLRDHRPLDSDRAARIAGQVAGALSAAHTAGIIHRDIKPANVMVTPQDAVKVLDFGIARAAAGAGLTATASVIGTAAFMAPEQVLGEPADERSDVYALGVVLYMMLTGHHPFQADSAAAMLHQQLNVDPTPPREENPEVPAGLSGIVIQMLDKSRDARPQTAAEVGDRVAHPEREQTAAPPTAATRAIPAPVSATRVLRSPPAGAADASAAGASSPDGSPPERARVRAALIAAGVILAVAVLAVALIAFAAGSSSPSSTTTTPAKPKTHRPHTSTRRRTTTSPVTTAPTTTSTTPHTRTRTITRTTTTPTTTTTTQATTPTTTTGTTPGATSTGPQASPGQGGVPPGQAKKRGRGGG